MTCLRVACFLRRSDEPSRHREPGLPLRRCSRALRRQQWGETSPPDAGWALDHEPKGSQAIIKFWHKAMQGCDAVTQTCLNGTCDLDQEAGTGTGRWHIQESFRRKDSAVGIMLPHSNDAYVIEDGK